MPGYIRFPAATVILSIVLSAAAAVAETPTQMLNEYSELVISGNYESARGFWTDESQRRAYRFGIEYTGIPLKVDCTSPLVRYTGAPSDFTRRFIGGETKLATGEYSRFPYEVEVGGTTLSHYYYTYHQGDYYWLMYPQDYFSQGWRDMATRFFEIRYHPDDKPRLNPVVLAQADRFIERTAKALGLTDKDLKLLENEKIHYFYCPGDNIVREITGHDIKGTYDLASDDIISAFFPHYHELVHFLLNFRLRRLDMYTQPLMREGLAVCYGGRWGKSPTAILALGGYIYREGIVSLDSIMTMQGFEQSAGADLSYPLSGLFAAFLLEKAGTEATLRLYRSLSGDFESLAAMTIPQVEDTVAAALDEPWEDVRADFDKFVDRWLADRSDLYPGVLDGGKELLRTDKLLVAEKDGWISVTASADSGATPQGNILFGRDSALINTPSVLYELQYQGKNTHPGYRYGIRFDKNEVGVYDYATNHLLSKYIWGIAPSKDYYSAESNTVRFRFPKDVAGGALPTENASKILSQ
ncbi:MAG: hypothetical protein JSW34_04155 [Candidatus Zixiibacteriota bacterium]|nr:MAG: hypothetical protein JSW34_04155 [candidate division Zixibacteria bacterium]